MQKRLQQQSEQVLQDLDSTHKRSNQQLQCRLSELEASCKELTEVKYKNDSVIRELKIKLAGAEEVSDRTGRELRRTLWWSSAFSPGCLQEFQHVKQQVASLRRENATLDTEIHDKERLVSQLQMRVAVLEQGISDKEQLVSRTKEVLEATQQQRVSQLNEEVAWQRNAMIVIASQATEPSDSADKPLK